MMGDGLVTPTMEGDNHFFSDSLHDTLLMELPVFDNMEPFETVVLNNERKKSDEKETNKKKPQEKKPREKKSEKQKCNKKKALKQKSFEKKCKEMKPKEEKPDEKKPRKKRRKLIKEVRVSLSQNPMEFTNVSVNQQHLTSVNDWSWCGTCTSAQESIGCPQHGLCKFLPDKVPPSLALATLPNRLRIGHCDESREHRGVFTNVRFPSRTVFGPFIAEKLNPAEVSAIDPLYLTDDAGSSCEVERHRFLLPVVSASGDVHYLKRTQPHMCNWMMFVRPASRIEEQNCVAWQRDGSIYFSTVLPIKPRRELRVWYAPDYAQYWEYPLLPPPCETSAPDPPPEVPQRTAKRPRKRRRRSCVTMPPKRPRKLAWKRPPTRSTILTAQRVLRIAVRRSRKRKRSRTPPDEMHCFDCGVTFCDDNLLRVHTLSHLGFPKETGPCIGCRCSVCFMVFQRSIDLAVHALEHALSETKVFCYPNLSREHGAYACGVCHQRVLTYKELCSHKTFCQTSLLQTIFEIEEEGVPERKIACRHCDQTFKTPSALKTHEKTHISKNFYRCVICQLQMPKKEYMEHAEQHRYNGVFRCPICAGGHKRQHHCRGVYPTFSRLCRHVTDVHSAATLPCPHCHMVFRRRSLLQQHIRSHTEMDTFMCDVCGRTYRRAQALQYHMRTQHSEEGAQRLLKTGKAFKPRGNRYFCCEVCGLRYSRKAALSQHYAVQHPDLELLRPELFYYEEVPPPPIPDLTASSFSELFLSPGQTFVMEQPEAAAGNIVYAQVPNEPPATGEEMIYLLAADVDGQQQLEQELVSMETTDLSEFVLESGAEFQIPDPLDSQTQIMIMDNSMPAVPESEVPILYPPQPEPMPNPEIIVDLNDGIFSSSQPLLHDDQWML